MRGELIRNQYTVKGYAEAGGQMPDSERTYAAAITGDGTPRFAT